MSLLFEGLSNSRFCSEGQYSLLVAGLFWAELCLCHWLPYRGWHTGPWVGT